jgi:hypothetical protein
MSVIEKLDRIPVFFTTVSVGSKNVVTILNCTMEECKAA